MSPVSLLTAQGMATHTAKSLRPKGRLLSSPSTISQKLTMSLKRISSLSEIFVSERIDPPKSHNCICVSTVDISRIAMIPKSTFSLYFKGFTPGIFVRESSSGSGQMRPSSSNSAVIFEEVGLLSLKIREISTFDMERFM